MLTLYGTPLSNNYNKAKLALLEKGIGFAEVAAPPSKEESFLQRSPMGKVPFIELDGRFLAESQAIVEYIEETHPDPALYPRDPWERAVCREVIDIIEFYMSTPAGRVLGAAFFGGTASDETKADVMAGWERTIGALKRVVKFDPYVVGKAFTIVDCAAFAHFGLVSTMSKIVYGHDVMETLPGTAKYMETMMTRPTVQKVVAGQTAAFQAFMASKAKK
jgi:glutathione S-transferase